MSKSKNTTNRNQKSATSALQRSEVVIGRDRYKQVRLSKGNLTFTLNRPASKKARKSNLLTILDTKTGLETTVGGQYLTGLQTVLAKA